MGNQVAAISPELNPVSKKALILVDRDGTINQCPEGIYVTDINDFFEIPRAFEALVELRSIGHTAVITNQAKMSDSNGIIIPEMLGKFTSIAMYIENCVRMIDKLTQERLWFYFCPHPEWMCCGCRKPDPGLLYEAVGRTHWDINDDIWIIGDHYSDVLVASRSGLPAVRTILVQTGRGSDRDTVKFFQKNKGLRPTATVPSLWEASQYIKLHYVRSGK